MQMMKEFKQFLRKCRSGVFYNRSKEDKREEEQHGKIRYSHL